jgi:hypothetical protein
VKRTISFFFYNTYTLTLSVPATNLFTQQVFTNTFNCSYYLYSLFPHHPIYMPSCCMISVLAFVFSFFCFECIFTPINERRGGCNRRKKTSFVMSSVVEYLSLFSSLCPLSTNKCFITLIFHFV